jgi:phosphatidate cytidylyltransferase
LPVDEPDGPVVPGNASQPDGPAAATPGGADHPALSGTDHPAPGDTDHPAPGNPDHPAPGDSNGPGPAGPPSPPGPPLRTRTGRNLPAALGVGLGMGGLALLTLFTVKATFLLYVGAMVAIALWELSRALGTRGIRVPLVPVALGGAAAMVLAYFEGERALVACLALTIIAVLAWRLPGSAAGYLRDVTAGVFALGYLPMPASFVALMLAAPDGSRRVLIFIILTACSDIGGYFAGIAVGRHLMVPRISPKKTWEGFAGSALACLAAGAITLPALLNASFWQGMLVGAVGALSPPDTRRSHRIDDQAGSGDQGHGDGPAGPWRCARPDRLTPGVRTRGVAAPARVCASGGPRLKLTSQGYLWSAW